MVLRGGGGGGGRGVACLWACGVWGGEGGLMGYGGGRVLGLEKGTDCGPTAAELWMSRPKMAKKKKGGGGGCLLIILYNKGTVRIFASNILH